MTFQLEHWKQFYVDAADIFPLHWEELALHKDTVKLDVDHEQYLSMDERGILHIVTARDKGILKGYYVGIVTTNPHYKSAGLMAFTDFYFVLPESRWAGAKLLIEVERTLRDRGVKRAYLSCKVHQDHTELFTKLGWKPSDYAFAKLIG